LEVVAVKVERVGEAVVVLEGDFYDRTVGKDVGV